MLRLLLLCNFTAVYCLQWTSLLVVAHSDRKGLGTEDELSLLSYLFEHKGYNPLIRPVSNLSDVVQVNLGLAMIQLIHVEEKSQVMKSNVWLRMTWFDYQLKWNKDDFGGISVVRVSPRRVWSPDIVLFNNADGKYEVSWQPNILIENTGILLWIPPAIYKSSCTIDVQFFPFDQQSCEMKFGSWTFDASQVALGWYEGNRNVDLSDYWQSGTWDLVDCPGVIRNSTKAGVQETQIVYTITMQRKTLFYTVNLLIPCVLISLLSVCVFYLPADAGEKITLSISILLALIVFLLLVSKILPPTSISIPLISKFLLFTFIMNILTIFITVIIINWNFRTPRTHQMHATVKLIFMNYLPRMLLMRRPEHIIQEEERRKSWRHQLPRPANSATTLKLLKASSSKVDTTDSPVVAIPMSSYHHHVTANSHFETVRNLHPQDSEESSSADDPWVKMDASTAQRSSSTVHPTEQHTFHHTPPPVYEDCLSSPPNQIHRTRQSTNKVQDIPSPTTAENYPVYYGLHITPEIRSTIAAVQFISMHLQLENEYMRVLQDWKYVASVIDRVQLVIFMTVTIIGTLSIVFHAPYIFTTVDQEAVIRKFSQ